MPFHSQVTCSPYQNGAGRALPRSHVANGPPLGPDAFNQSGKSKRSRHAALTKSANFLRAWNMRVFTVASATPAISATSLTDLPW
jgi:hypothetical protein